MYVNNSNDGIYNDTVCWLITSVVRETERFVCDRPKVWPQKFLCICVYCFVCGNWTTTLGVVLWNTVPLLWDRVSHWLGLYQLEYSGWPSSLKDPPVSTSEFWDCKLMIFYAWNFCLHSEDPMYVLMPAKQMSHWLGHSSSPNFNWLCLCEILWLYFRNSTKTEWMIRYYVRRARRVITYI